MLNMQVFPKRLESFSNSENRTYCVKVDSSYKNKSKPGSVHSSVRSKPHATKLIHPVYPPKMVASPLYSAKLEPPSAKRTSSTNLNSLAPNKTYTLSQQDKEKHITIDKNTGTRMCAICYVTFTSGSHELAHMKGKKHKKMIKKVFGEFGRCELCDIKYESCRDGIGHLFSQVHIKKQRELDMKNGRVVKTLSKLVAKPSPPASETVPKRTRATAAASAKVSDDSGMQCIYTRSAQSGIPEEDGKAASEERMSSKRKRSNTQRTVIAPAKKPRKESSQHSVKRFCTNCGDPVSPENNFCGGCGEKLKKS